MTKWQNDRCFQGKPLNIIIIQVYAPTTNTVEGEVEWFWDDLQDLLELTPKKMSVTSQDGMQSGKPRDTWSNRQVLPWHTKWSMAKDNKELVTKSLVVTKSNKVVTKSLLWECTGHSKHPLPTTQEKTLQMDITRWSTLKSDWLFSLQPKMEKIYTVSKNKTRSWLWLRSWFPYCQIKT